MYLCDKLITFDLKGFYENSVCHGFLKVDNLNLIKYLTGFFEDSELIGAFHYENEIWTILNEDTSNLLNKMLKELKEMGYEI